MALTLQKFEENVKTDECHEPNIDAHCRHFPITKTEKFQSKNENVKSKVCLLLTANNFEIKNGITFLSNISFEFLTQNLTLHSCNELIHVAH